MKRALIGHSGFVGSNLKRTESFSHFYNSTNFREMANQHYDEVVCAGVSAVKWMANKEPTQDWEAIQSLLHVLDRTETSRFTLISTIDTYPDPSLPLDEAAQIADDAGQPYGRHRRAVERFILDRFEDVLIARLPALFGNGLKKNIVFDLLTGNQTNKIDPSAVFQWYPLERLAGDLLRARQAGLTIVNLFPEPLPSSVILRELFPDAVVGEPSENASVYRLETAHANVFGSSNRYLMSADTVLSELKTFVQAARFDRNEVLG